MSAALFSLVFPDSCRVCGADLPEISRIPVCAACLASPEPLVAGHFCVSCRSPFLNPAPLDESGRCLPCRMGMRGFDGLYAYGEYDGALRKLIHLFKYEGVTPLAGPLGALLSRALPRGERWDMVVPVPLHWKRRWQRGYNQTELLARVLSRRTGIPVVRAVRRRRSTGSQAGLTAAQRRRNVSGAFAARVSVNGCRVLLVDDVVTTGATAGACAAALRRAGAEQVSVLALARADRRRGFSGLTLA